MTPNVDLSRELLALKRASRRGDLIGPYQSAAELKKKHPAHPELAEFYNGMARRIDARRREALSENALDEAFRLAMALKDNTRLATNASTTLLEIMRQRYSIQKTALELLRICRTVPDNLRFWDTLALCLDDLQPSLESAGLALEIADKLPGDARVIAFLDRFEAAENSPDTPLEAATESGTELPSMKTIIGGMSEASDPLSQKAYFRSLRQAYVDADDGQNISIRRVFAWRELEKRIQSAIATPIGESPPPTLSPVPETGWSAIDPKSPLYGLSNAEISGDAARALFDQHPSSGRSLHIITRLKIILSLWLQSTNREASQDRIGYLWLVVDPLIHIMIICIVPVLLHGDRVFGMEILPFGVIGACNWMIFRHSVTGAMFGGGVLVSQLSHTPIRRFDVTAARSLNAPIIYFIVGGTIISVGFALGHASAPQNFVFFSICILTSWLMGFSYGLISNMLVYLYPGFRRLNGFALRLTGFTSGLFFVSEQLPDQVSSILLYNPMLHNAQLARSFWFAEYNSRHASPTYVFLFLISVVLLGLACTKLSERRHEELRA